MKNRILFGVFKRLCYYFEELEKHATDYVEYRCGDRECSLTIGIPIGFKIYTVMVKYKTLPHRDELGIAIEKIDQGLYSSITYVVSSIEQEELVRALKEVARIIREYLIVFNEVSSIEIFDIEFYKTINGKVVPILAMSFHLGDHTLFIHVAALSPNRDVIVPLPPSRTIYPLR